MSTSQIIHEIRQALARKYAPATNKLADTENNARLKTGYQARQSYSGQRGRRLARKSCN